MLDGDVDPPDVEPWERHDGEAHGPARSGLGLDALTLEDILTAWARDPASFRRTDVRFNAYVSAILEHGDALGDADRKALVALQAIWTVARDELLVES